jgi:hypothetical protein
MHTKNEGQEDKTHPVQGWVQWEQAEGKRRE